MEFNYLKTSVVSAMAVGALAFSTSMSAAGWKSIITGGSAAEGLTHTSIEAGWSGPAAIVANPAGEGVVFEFQVSENTPNDNGNYDDWKSQMFICFDEPLMEGDVVKVSFYHYCTDTRNVGMQAQGNKGTYQGNFQGFETKSEWQLYSQEFEVSAQYAGSEGFKTIAICLASAAEAATFYINNVVVEKEVAESADAPVPASVIPAEGTLDILESVSLVFAEDATVAWTVTDTPLIPTVYKEGETDAFTLASPYGNSLVAEGNVLTFNLSRVAKVAGKYTVKFPAGSYSVNGVPGGACEYTYTVSGEAADPFAMTVTPDTSVVDQIEVVVITFPNASEVTVSDKQDSEFVSRLYLVEDGEESARDMLAATAEANRLVLKTFRVPVTAPGEYVLKVPEGLYSVDGVEGKEIVLSFTIPEPTSLSYTVTPEEGAVDVLETIEIAFDGVEKVIWNMEEMNTEFAPYIEDVLGNNRYIFYNLTTDKNKLLLTYNGGFSIEGAYNVVIPAGTYSLITGDVTDEETNETSPVVVSGQEIVLEYDVLGLGRYSVEPSVNILTELSEIYITFTNGTITLPEDLGTDKCPYYMIVPEEGNPERRGTLYPEVIGNNVLKLRTMYQPETAPGEYIVIVPGNTYFIDGQEGYDIQIQYTLIPDESLKDATYTVDPKEGEPLAGLHTIAIDFTDDDVETVFWNLKDIDADKSIAPTITNNGEVMEGVTLSNLYSDVTTLYAAINQLNPIKENGYYVINIPAASYTVAGKNSVDIVLAYYVDSVTAVNAVFGEKVNVNVYDANGRLVLRNADASALQGLRGIYVIDGKKYILR